MDEYFYMLSFYVFCHSKGFMGFMKLQEGQEARALAPVTEMQQDRTDMPSHLLSLEKKVKNSNAKIDTSYSCIHCF